MQHYEDKQKEHLACIKRHKDLLAAKEKELEVGISFFPLLKSDDHDPSNI